LLANIYLNELDHLIGEKYRMVRYADDFVILTTCEADAENALAEVRKWMESHQLELHPEKTRIVNSTSDPNGFDLSGLHLQKGNAVGAQEKPKSDARQDQTANPAKPGSWNNSRYRPAQPDTAWLV
jgi:hypothetical protein